MRRDYKNRGRTRKKKKAETPWVPLVAGATVGAVITAALMVWVPGAWNYVAAWFPQVPEPPVRSAEAERAEKAALPEPRFDFYTLLPEMEVVVPEREIAGSAHKGNAQVQQPGSYMLQVGSFRKQPQADRLKAELLLMGLEVSVEAVRINNNQPWYRVRVGPYQNLASLRADRAKLGAGGHDAVPIRLKP